MNSGAPRSCSRARIEVDSADCAMWHRRAARVKFRSSATATNCSSWWTSIDRFMRSIYQDWILREITPYRLRHGSGTTCFPRGFMARFAKVLTLHLPSEQIASLLNLLDDGLVARHMDHPGFRGLLCLEQDEGANRSQISVVLSWDDENFEYEDDAVDRWWAEVAEVFGVGVARSTWTVLRDIPRHRAWRLTE